MPFTEPRKLVQRQIIRSKADSGQPVGVHFIFGGLGGGAGGPVLQMAAVAITQPVKLCLPTVVRGGVIGLLPDVMPGNGVQALRIEHIVKH